MQRKEHQQMRQKLRTTALLSVLTVLVAGATASAASAAIQYEWKVGGSPLASGATKEFTVKDKGSGLFTLHMELSGFGIIITSSKLKVQSAAEIAGGKPGAGSETLELEGVKVTNFAGCAVKEIEGGKAEGKLTTRPLRTEIVQGAVGGVGNGKVDLLFTPKTEKNALIEFEFTGSCAIKGLIGKVNGSVLAEVSPQKTEAKIGDLIFEAKTKEYQVSDGVFHKAGLYYVAEEPETLTGEAEMELVSKEAFGAF
jgi:hypothetical protein